MSVKKIEAWEAADGQMFDNAEDAYAHEHNLNIMKGVTTFWQLHGYSGMTVQDVVDFCIEFGEDLAKALAGKT